MAMPNAAAIQKLSGDNWDEWHFEVKNALACAGLGAALRVTALGGPGEWRSGASSSGSGSGAAAGTSPISVAVEAAADALHVAAAAATPTASAAAAPARALPVDVDERAHAFICSTINVRKYRGLCERHTTAQGLWEALRDMHVSKVMASRALLVRQAASLRMTKGESVHDYWARAEDLHEQLNLIEPYRETLTQALEGLPAGFDIVVNEVLHKPLRYSVTVLDEYSSLVAVVLIKQKSDAPAAIIDMLTQLQRQTGRRVVALRSDRGGEYMGDEMQHWLRAQGITHQQTAPYSPEMNGSAELIDRTLMACVRAIVFASGAPKHLCGEAICATAHLHNVSPVAEKPCTPFEAAFGSKPDIAHLRVWGCPAYVHDPAHDGKLASRSIKGLFVGYEPGGKAYRARHEAAKSMEQLTAAHAALTVAHAAVTAELLCSQELYSQLRERHCSLLVSACQREKQWELDLLGFMQQVDQLEEAFLQQLQGTQAQLTDTAAALEAAQKDLAAARTELAHTKQQLTTTIIKLEQLRAQVAAANKDKRNLLMRSRVSLLFLRGMLSSQGTKPAT
ncbi:hypothetical protein QJQ45_012969 [Haematococcus lacustris]|nr:hypothetical protein QJQ45_012969 [Haematococcus lacustris]